MTKKRGQTRTGGRQASVTHIPGDVALAVGMPPNPAAPDGWEWVPLPSVARMESGHTPSRRHPEWWDGDIPWIGIRDAKAHHGRVISETNEYTNQLGLDNSSARLLPARTVCLSRTASVGYVTIMGRPMATSQDFVNWVCGENLDPEFLKYIFLANERALLRFASGAVHSTIYYPEAKAFHICLPPLAEQKRIVAVLDEAFEAIERAEAAYARAISETSHLMREARDALFSDLAASVTTVRLGDVCALRNGRAYKKSELLAEGPYPVLRVGNFFTNQNWYYSDLELDEAKYCDDGDLLYAWSASFGPRIWSGGKVIYHYHIWRVDYDSDKVLRDFLFHWFAWDADLIQAEHGTGSTIMHVTKGAMENRNIALPDIEQQQALCDALSGIQPQIECLHAAFDRKRRLIGELKAAILREAFGGELSLGRSGTSAADDKIATQVVPSTLELNAGVLALAYEAHRAVGTLATFGHVKAEKIAHMAEAFASIDLGRRPVKDAAGPNDTARRREVEQFAADNGYFEFVKRGQRYEFKPGPSLDRLIAEVRPALQCRALSRVLDLMAPMNTEDAEVLATVYAAWNNLLIDGEDPDTKRIARAAREDWHEQKSKIQPTKFSQAIKLLRDTGLEPDGSARRVADKVQQGDLWSARR